jgi:hypothetical protein
MDLKFDKLDPRNIKADFQVAKVEHVYDLLRIDRDCLIDTTFKWNPMKK